MTECVCFFDGNEERETVPVFPQTIKALDFEADQTLASTKRFQCRYKPCSGSWHGEQVPIVKLKRFDFSELGNGRELFWELTWGISWQKAKLFE